MASKKVNIQIDTKADTTGAKQAETAVEKVTDATKQAGVEQKRVARETAAAEKQAAKEASDAAKQLARDKKQAAREAAEAQKKAAREASQEERRAARESAEAVKLAAVEKKKALMEEKAAAAAAATASQRVGTVVSQAGFQVQDFAIQVAGGTSALTAMAQQAPQFLGVFGPGGAIAGALIAVGAIAAKVFLAMGDDAAAAKEEAQFLADAIKTTGENAARAIAEDVDFGLKKISDAATKAESYIGVLNRVATAQEAASLSSEQSAETLRQTETEIARLMGQKIDEAKEIDERLKGEAAIRQQIAQNAINERARELDDAIKLEGKKAETLAKTQQELDITKQKREETAALLELERQRRDELQKIVDTNPTQFQAFIGGPETRGDPRARAAAERQLADPVLQETLDSLQRQVDAYDKQIAEAGGTLVEAVQRAGDALEAAATSRQVIEQTLATEVPQVQQELQTANIVAQVEGIKEIATQAATDVQQVIDQVKPANAAEAAALETLKPMVSDKQITADETLRTAQALAVLDGAIRTQMGNAATNTDKLIQTVNTLTNRLLSQQRQIDSINARIRSGN